MKKIILRLAVCIILFFIVFSPTNTFANNVANPVNSSISISKDSLPADGATTVTITVVLKDNTGNIIPNDHLTLTSTTDLGIVINGGPVGTTNFTVATDSDGKAYFNINSRNPSSVTDTFTIVDISDNPPVTIGTVKINFWAAPLASNPSCSDGTPGSAPQLTSASANSPSEIVLKWTAAKDPITHYLVAYGNTSGQYIYGNPNIGDKNTTTYTVGYLSPGTKYYFTIRAVNGCKSGAFSNELFAITTGGVVINTPSPDQAPLETSNKAVQNNMAPTNTPINTPADTPNPSQIIQSTATPTPSQTLMGGLSKTRVLEYIFMSILVFGGFIYWKHKKG